MNISIRRITQLLTVLAVSSLTAFSASYDLISSTPVGSWQLRQEITTDHKGKAQLSEIKTSLVGEEKRDGVDYVWVEMSMKTFKYKKGEKGKEQGDGMVIKVLLEKSLLKGKPEDVFNNMRGLGKEIIMQQGDADPMKIEEGGMLGGAMMQSLGMEIDYNFEEKGSETADVPAGKFKCKVVEGEGSVSAKIVFKTIKVDSTVKQWIGDVPFGIVKSEDTSTMDGKTSTTSAVLLDYGKSGAVSEITKEPQAMPGLGSIFGG